jgi:hypothetical protein
MADFVSLLAPTPHWFRCAYLALPYLGHALPWPANYVAMRGGAHA